MRLVTTATPSNTPTNSPTQTPSGSNCVNLSPTPTATFTPTQTITQSPFEACPEQIIVSGVTGLSGFSGTYDRLRTYTGGTFNFGYLTASSGPFNPDTLLLGNAYAVYGRQSGSDYYTIIRRDVGTDNWNITLSTGDYIINGGTLAGGTSVSTEVGINVGGIYVPRTGFNPGNNIYVSYPSVCPTTTPTSSVTPTITPTSTVTPTITPTASCPVTIQYLDSVVVGGDKIRLNLWTDSGYTIPTVALCDYIVSGTMVGSSGTTYSDVRTFPQGDHQIQLNFTPFLQPGEVIIYHTVNSVNTSACTCPVIVEFVFVPPTPTPTSTPTVTPTQTSTVTPTSSITPTVTETPTVTPTITPTNTLTPTVTPTITVTPSSNPVCPQEVVVSITTSGYTDFSGTYSRLYTYTGGSFTYAYFQAPSPSTWIFDTPDSFGNNAVVYGRFDGTNYYTLFAANVVTPSNIGRQLIAKNPNRYAVDEPSGIPAFVYIVGLSFTTIDSIKYPNPGTYTNTTFGFDITFTYPLSCPTPTPTKTPTNTPTRSVTPTTTPTNTLTPTNTATPTLTPTPTSTPICCYQYEITNYYSTTQTINYIDCNGTPSSINAAANNQTIVNCAVEGSLSFSGTSCDGGNVDCVTWVAANTPCGGCV